MSSVLRFAYFPGTLSGQVADVVDVSDGTIVESGATITELTAGGNARGEYSVTNSGTETGLHSLHVYPSGDDVSGAIIPPMFYRLKNDGANHYPIDPGDNIEPIWGEAFTLDTLLVLASDHVTAATGLSPTAQISKDGGAFSSASNSVSEIANGVYSLTLTATEMKSKRLTVLISAATADSRILTIYPNQ